MIATPASAQQGVEQINRRLDQLERENAQLRKDIMDVTSKPMPSYRSKNEGSGESGMRSSFAIGTDSSFSYEMLDPTQAGKSKPLLLIDAARSGALQKGTIIGGALTAVTDFQWTNVPDKMGYMMRHPGEHPGKTASEAMLHSAQVGIATNYMRGISSYVELLYEPTTSFGTGTPTDLSRNLVQVRRGYITFGDLKSSPFYAQIGKIDSPFGYGSTVNPFSLSMTSHGFAGLSYGALVGYSRNGLNIALEAAQGGAEFRGLNSPVHGTKVPSDLNNFVGDINYRIPLGAARSFMLGASYEHGSSYCQNFPITHFGACATNNPAYAVYAEFVIDRFKVKGEFAQTVKAWPGTRNPNAPLNRFDASPVTAFDVGVSYETMPVLWGRPVTLSAEYSKLNVGASGSPWEFQDQLVAGIAYKPKDSVKLFVEGIRVEGYAPLQFLSGGVPGLPPTFLFSDRNGQTNVVLAGINAAF